MTTIGNFQLTGPAQNRDGCTFTPARRLADNIQGHLTNEHCITDFGEVVGQEVSLFIHGETDDLANLNKPQYNDTCTGITKDGKTIKLQLQGGYGETGMYSVNWTEQGQTFPINIQNGARTRGYSGTVFNCGNGKAGTYSGYDSAVGYVINP